MNSRDDERLERWLHGVLDQYGKPEPRAGLEGRIIARLAAEEMHSVIGWRWWAGAASTAIVCAIALVIWVGRSSPLSIEKGVRSAGNNSMHTGPQSKAAVALPLPSGMRTSEHSYKSRIQRIARTTRTALYRPAQFPTPRPLDRQEIAIADYARHFPEEALLVAQEHAQFEHEIEQAQREAENAASASDQER